MPRPRWNLETLVQSHDSSGAAIGQPIRKLRADERQSFYAETIEVLRTRDESSGSQYLVSMLVANQLLVPVLCDLALTRERALAVAQAAAKAGVMVDVMLAKHLSEQAPSIGDGACPADLQRSMDILAEISDGTRILPCLMALARQTNPALVSKAVLMIGRLNRNVKWVLNRLSDSDPRVRANAIEGLWGVDTEEARRLLRSAASDANNRVAGNALFALYQLGDCWAIPELLKMANHESGRFRVTAAWAMGETGDPRFTKTLARMVGEPNVSVRTGAFAALGKIRAATARVHQAGARSIVACFQPNGQSGWRELHVDVGAKDGPKQARLLPTEFILVEDGQDVVSFAIEECPVPPLLSITFILPGIAGAASTPFQQGALKALAWKRPPDFWSLAHYIPAVRPSLDTSPEEQQTTSAAAQPSSRENIPLQFTADPEVAAAALEKVPPQTDCSDLWTTIRHSVQGAGPERGERHVLVYGQSEAAQPVGYRELTSAALASGASVHAISLIGNPALESLCSATQGDFQTVASEAEVPALVEQVYLSLLARYTVRYQPISEQARKLRIIVNSPSGWGEYTILIPPQPAQAG
ncbi:MAG: HEAT repeat domain-containing protein [Acidobacteriia bacterium]|nr:HEAT repeat domain-containing protein [Terriglobia bacterium]